LCRPSCGKMCGSSADPHSALRCAGVWCLVLGIIGGVTAPAALCGIIVGSVILCCNGDRDPSCAKCGAITGLVFAIIELIACVALGALLIVSVNTYCGIAQTAISTSCSSRRLSTFEPPVLRWPEHEQHAIITPAMFKVTMASTRASLITAFGGTPAAALQNISALIKFDHEKRTLDFKRTDGMKNVSVTYRAAALAKRKATARVLQSGSGSGTVAADDNSCDHALDGMCDDGGTGSMTSLCLLGTDCDDCGIRGGASECTLIVPQNDDTCTFAGDGMCDDGGVNAQSYFCDCGSDYQDCGYRQVQECDAMAACTSQTECCTAVSSIVSSVCDTYRMLGYLLLFAGTIVSLAQTISFCCVMKNADAVVRKVGVQAQPPPGSAMMQQQPAYAAAAHAQPVVIATPVVNP